MSIEIKEVLSKSDLKKFIRFPIDLYKKNEYYVPPMKSDEITSLTKGKNPSLEHSKLRMWLAYDGKQIIGRIAGIIHGIESIEKKLVRFGWFDFIDDESVSKALIKTVEEWALSEGLEGIHGPLGFTDMDFEGMLVDGFDEMATIATIYNFSYYVDHMNSMGFEKSVDWVELAIPVPEKFSDRTERLIEMISKKYEIRIVPFKSAKDMLPYTDQLFQTLNKAFGKLYGFHELTQNEIDFYIKKYFDFVLPGYNNMVVDKDDKVVGFAVSMPSLSKAFRKAKGNMFPFGILHILKAVKFNDIADLYLIGTDPEYQSKGVANLLMSEGLKAYNKDGIKVTYTNPMLENNTGVLNQMMKYSGKIRKRRRCFIKSID